jgi:hypothetical protein
MTSPITEALEGRERRTTGRLSVRQCCLGHDDGRGQRGGLPEKEERRSEGS